jgi:hypothetical protein
MTPDDIQKAIHDGIAKALAEQLPLAVATAVNASVNGKVQAMRNDLKPITDAYSNWLSWKRIALMSFGVVLAIGGFIQAAQALYGIVSNLFVISVR